MRRRGAAPVSVGILLCVTLWLFGNSTLFNDLIDDFENWKSGQTPGEIPDSFPDLDELADKFTEFTIPDSVQPPPGMDPSTTEGTATPTEPQDPTTPEGTQVLDLDVLDPTLPSLRPIPEANRHQAVALIEQVRTAGRGPKTGYDRDEFGQAWTDDNPDPLFGHDGCDTRNNILARDFPDETFKPNTNDCVVLTGTLNPEPYTGEPVQWDKQTGGLDIEHVVALSASWQMGAAHWDEETRIAFANDPLNLFAADASSNRQKGDATPASWLPPSRDIRCAYVTRYAAVSLRYDLAVTEADKEMMVRQCQ